nr:reverse transcriptase domain-containing protein [Tanacetum cinerariifolium]
MSTNDQTPLSQPTSVVRNTLGKEQTLQDLVRPIFVETLREYYDKNYHQILPIITEEVHQEKEHRAKEGASRKGLDIGMLVTPKAATRVLTPKKEKFLLRNIITKENPREEWKHCHKLNQNQRSRIRALRMTCPNHGGEVAASNRERKKSFLSWKQQEAGQRQNFKKGSFQNQQRTARKQYRFTLLTKTPKEILALEKGKFKPPPVMTTLVEERNASKFCEFHGEVGHTTNEFMHLKRKIEEMLKAGKLSCLIKELKQSSGKDQAKAAKKG